VSRFVLVLQPLPRTDPVKALRTALKRLLRDHKLLSVREESQPLQPTESPMDKSELEYLRRFTATCRQRGDFGAPILKCDGNTGDYKAGKAAKDMNKAHLVAEVPRIMIGHQKIAKGQKPLYAIGLVADGFQPLSKKELGDDRDAENGGWAEVSMLPMFDQETREVYLFTATSQGGRDGIATLADAYLQNAEHHPEDADKLPLIELASDSYINTAGKRIFYPVLEILAWVPRPAAVRYLEPPPVTLEASQPAKIETVSAPPAKKAEKRTDMNDEIPF
jgi:hypothetical protein